MSLREIPLLGSALFKGLIAVGVAALIISSSDNVSVAFDGNREYQGAGQGAEVKNFGKVNDHIYRGAQPAEGEYKKLAAIGIKTIIVCVNVRRGMLAGLPKTPDCNTSTSG